MAIYRSDQASVTFAAEGSPGAYPELATITSAVGVGLSAAARTVATALVAGDQSITLNNTCANTALVGNGQFMIAVGGVNGADGPHEVRKVVDGFTTTTITLDHPLAFAHAVGAPVVGLKFHDTNVDTVTKQTLSGPAYHTQDLITWLPGVYDAIDVPDPEQAFEPYYILGGQNRNLYSMYPGQETLAGSIGGMVLLNATPLRFPLGSMVTLPNTTAVFSGSGGSVLVGTAANTGPAANKGATVVRAYTASSRAVIAAGTLVCFGSDDADDDTELGGAITSSDFSILPKSTYEVRRLMRNSANGAGTTHTLYLDTPLRYAHKINEVVTNVTGSTYYHTIWEKTALDSITMNVSVLDSEETTANTWQRRYVGGKVGSMTISAEEGGLVTVGWDSMLFLDMIHNMKQHSELPASGADKFMPRYGVMKIINPTSVGKPVHYTAGAGDPTYVRPSTAPYYFSQGTIRWFGSDPNSDAGGGQILARLRSFSITVANSEEPRYYLKKQQEGKRGPTEILEQRREYSMSASVAMDDSNTGAAGIAQDNRNVFKELLLAGDYRGTEGLRGFAIELTFSRSATDRIQIRIPGENFGYNANQAGESTVTGAVTSTGGEQGAFIRSATHNIGDTNPIEAEIDILFRSMIINIQDSEPVYP